MQLAENTTRNSTPTTFGMIVFPQQPSPNLILTCCCTDLDDKTLEKNKKEFDEPPDMLKPLDVYFRKQERCMKIATDSDIPINEGKMILKLQIHMGQSGMVNRAYTNWKRKAPATAGGPQENLFRHGPQGGRKNHQTNW